MKKKLLFTCLLVCFIFIMAGCIENLRGPSWNTTARLPLIASSVSISELLEDVDDEDLNIPETDDPISYSFEFDIDSFEMGEIKITPDNITSDTAVGAITISDLLDEEETFNNIPAGADLSDPLVADPLSISIEVDTVSFESGNMEVEVTNEFDLETLENFKLILDGIGEVDLGDIGPGDSVTGQIALDGTTISDDIEVTAEGTVSSVGSDPGDIKVALSIEQATVTSIEGLDSIDQPISQTVQFNLGDIGISEMEIEDGSFEIAVTSPAGTNLEFDILSIELNGTALPKIGDAYDLSGITIPGSNITFEVEGNISNEDPGAPVNIDSTDEFNVEITFNELTLSSVTGEIEEEIELDEERLEFGEFPEELEGVHLRDLDARVIIENNSGIKMDFSKLYVTSVAGDPDPPTIGPAVVNPYETGEFQVGNIILDIINEHPDELFIGGKVSIGDGTEATVSKDDTYKISVEGSVPFSIDIPAGGINYKIDAQEIDTSELDMDPVTDYIDSGKLHMFVGNNFPMGIKVSIYFSDDKDSLYEEHNKEYTFIVNPGLTDDKGRVIDETSNSIDISLDKSTLDLFENDPLYMGLEIEIPNETGEPIPATLTSANSIRFSTYAEMVIKVNQRGDM